MKIIISPAKKMNIREDELDTAGLPCFLSKAEELKEYIRSLSFEEAKELWACNEAIARLNFERFAYMDLKKRLTPALLSYEGIQYQYMAPGVFEQKTGIMCSPICGSFPAFTESCALWTESCPTAWRCRQR